MSRVSVAPRDAQKGGLWDGGPGVINSARYEMFDYGGQGPETPALHLVIQPDPTTDNPEPGEPINEFLSCGSAARLRPSEDGLYLEAVSEGVTGLSDQSKAHEFLTSLVNAGFAEDKLAESDIDCLDGLHARFARVEGKQRNIRGSQPRAEGKGKSTMLIVQEILKGKAPAKGAAKSAAKSAAKVAPDDENEAEAEGESLNDKVAALLMSAIAEAGKPITLAEATKATFTGFDGDARRGQALKLLKDESFLAAAELFSWDAKKKVFKEAE